MKSHGNTKFTETIGIPKVWLDSYYTRLKEKTRRISPKPRNSKGLAACQLQEAQNQSKINSTENMEIPMIRLRSRHKNLKPKQNEIHWNHWNSCGLASSQPQETQSQSETKLKSDGNSDGLVAFPTQETQSQINTEFIQTMGIPMVWLHSSHKKPKTKATSN